MLRRLWPYWDKALVMVKPATVISRHRAGFRLYRRECLDHMIVLNERRLRRILREYIVYYHQSRTHMGLNNDCPIPRAVQPPEMGQVFATPVLGGLHHEYRRRVA